MRSISSSVLCNLFEAIELRRYGWPAPVLFRLAFYGVWHCFGPYFVIVDDRKDDGEPRYRAFGLIDDEPCALVFTTRNGAVRPISLRRAHDKEYRRHVR